VGGRQVLEPVGIWYADRFRHPFSSPSVRSRAWHRCRFPARPRSQLPDFFPTAFFSCKDISSHCNFFRARKAGTDPDLFLSPGKENSIDKNSDGARV